MLLTIEQYKEQVKELQHNNEDLIIEWISNNYDHEYDLQAPNFKVTRKSKIKNILIKSSVFVNARIVSDDTVFVSVSHMDNANELNIHKHVTKGLLKEKGRVLGYIKDYVSFE